MGATKILTVGKAPDYLEIGEERFELCSVIEHIGKYPMSGHYIAHSNLGGWIECNDTQITSYQGQRGTHSRNALGFMYRKVEHSEPMEVGDTEATIPEEESEEEADTVFVGNITDIKDASPVSCDIVETIQSNGEESDRGVDTVFVRNITDNEDAFSVHSDIVETIHSEEEFDTSSICLGNSTEDINASFPCSDIDPDILRSDKVLSDDETETISPEHEKFKYQFGNMIFEEVDDKSIKCRCGKSFVRIASHLKKNKECSKELDIKDFQKALNRHRQRRRQKDCDERAKKKTLRSSKKTKEKGRINLIKFPKK